MNLLSFFLATLVFVTTQGQRTHGIVGTYFPNWAQWRSGSYKYTPDSLKPIIDKVDIIWYAFAFFCPTPEMFQPYWMAPPYSICANHQPYQLAQPESNDEQFYTQLIAFKQQKPSLQVILSVGGWTFPSNFWSNMVAEKANRDVFIKSCMDYMNKYNFDGIDIDWEYPCSPNRTDEVKIDCNTYQHTVDEGGKCPDDRDNLYELVKEMRAAFDSNFTDHKMITIAGQADIAKATNGFNIPNMDPYVDLWNLMTYDYSVSDIDSANVTAPNEPLYPPKSAEKHGVSQDSVSTTIEGWLAEGATPNKTLVGVSYYGHLWYTPNMGNVTNLTWAHFGVNATKQNECCLVMQDTWAAKYGKYCQQCGTYMFSEIKEAGFDVYFDPETFSNIGYASNPTDGYTANGTWISYQDTQTVGAIVQYALGKGLAGAFAFDISMDNLTDYVLTNTMYDNLNPARK